MIKRYEPYQHGSWFEAKKYGEWVKHDDHLAECDRRVAEERRDIAYLQERIDELEAKVVSQAETILRLNKQLAKAEGDKDD